MMYVQTIGNVGLVWLDLALQCCYVTFSGSPTRFGLLSALLRKEFQWSVQMVCSSQYCWGLREHKTYIGCYLLLNLKQTKWKTDVEEFFPFACLNQHFLSHLLILTTDNNLKKKKKNSYISILNPCEEYGAYVSFQ